MPQKTVFIIGVGAFGEFMASHLCDHFHVVLYDEYRDLSALSDKATIGALSDIARADYVVLAVPVKYLDDAMQTVSPYLQSGQILFDVASVKCKPRDIIQGNLPEGVDYIGLHPLFGPESGKNGIAGLNVAVTGEDKMIKASVCDFLRDDLGLYVFETTAEDHDRQMAYVQGLSHMIGKAFHNMNIPDLPQSTHSFSLLKQMADNVKNDSDDLFVSIQHDNPYAEKVREEFFDSVRHVENMFEDD